jgi:hypothetical protein
MQHSLVRVGFVLSTVLLTTIAGVSWASEGGIVAKSGKQGSSCQQCHTGGKAPNVKLDGPLALEAGTIAAYTFRVETDAAVAVGMNAAISEADGIMYSDDAGSTREEDNEVTHSKAGRFDDAGVFTYSFFVKAPPYGGKLTVYAAGNACNGNGQNDGDESSRTTLTVDVSGPERPPPPEAGPPKPPTGPTTTPTVDASTKRADDDAGTGGNLAAPEEDSGCSIGWADRSSAPAGAMLAALAGLAAITRKKRRRR